MCLYQPNAPPCTCAFYQLVQPCSQAQLLSSPNDNPNPVIQVCPNIYFAHGVGQRFCPQCCPPPPPPPLPRHMRSPALVPSTAPPPPPPPLILPHPPLPLPSPGFAARVASPPRYPPAIAHLQLRRSAHRPTPPGPGFASASGPPMPISNRRCYPIHLPPLPPLPPHMQVPLPIPIPMPQPMPVLPPMHLNTNVNGAGPNGAAVTSPGPGVVNANANANISVNRGVQAELPAGGPVRFGAMDEAGEQGVGGGGGDAGSGSVFLKVEDLVFGSRDTAVQTGLETGLLGSGRRADGSKGEGDWDVVGVKEEGEEDRGWFV